MDNGLSPKCRLLLDRLDRYFIRVKFGTFAFWHTVTLTDEVTELTYTSLGNTKESSLFSAIVKLSKDLKEIREIV